ncbi:MAG: DUF882 domain-containing protein [Methyloceanibacter sp.]
MAVRGIVASRAMLGAGLAIILAGAWLWPAAQPASAAGESRTLSLFNIHTKENLTVTFKKDGRYDADALKQLNHFMRDWRRDASREMDPELIDHIWTLHQQLGSKKPVHLISAYRSSATNESMRKRGGGQAKRSQHILGKAADISFPDIPVKELRNSALVQEWGGVGYYPTSGVPFVHVDTGRVRMWPRIARLELAALFPSGQTKYLPTDGKPITPRDYQIALAKGKVPSKTLVAAAVPAPTPKPRSQPAVVAEAAGTLRPILASYTPEPAPSPAMAGAPSQQAARLPAHRPFVYASLGGLPRYEPEADLGGVAGFPLYQSAEVVGAPEVDDDHPDELSYVPFEIASLMTDMSVSYNHAAASLSRPEQHDLSYLFEDMDRPLAATFRANSNYQGLAAAQRFSGHAVRDVYAELEPPAPTRLAQADR